MTNHEIIVLGISALPAAVLFGYIVVRYVAALRNRPSISKEEILYQEFFASGASQKNILTRLGGANNCLRLLVTRDLLWVTSWFPFSVFAATYDLVHVIPLRSISSIGSSRHFFSNSLLLSFTDEFGQGHSLQLIPKNPDRFLAAIGRAPERSDASSAG